MADYVQNTITAEPAVGMAGLPYDSGPYDIITCIAQEDIPFGSFVRVSGGNCELADSAAEVTDGEMGVAVRVPTKVSGAGHKQGDPIPVMRHGRIWVSTEQAIAAQANPFVRHTAGAGGTVLGLIRNDADTASAAQPPGVSVFRGSPGAGLAVVQLNYPGIGTGT